MVVVSGVIAAMATNRVAVETAMLAGLVVPRAARHGGSTGRSFRLCASCRDRDRRTLRCGCGAARDGGYDIRGAPAPRSPENSGSRAISAHGAGGLAVRFHQQYPGCGDVLAASARLGESHSDEPFEVSDSAQLRFAPGRAAHLDRQRVQSDRDGACTFNTCKPSDFPPRATSWSSGGPRCSACLPPPSVSHTSWSRRES